MQPSPIYFETISVTSERNPVLLSSHSPFLQSPQLQQPLTTSNSIMYSFLHEWLCTVDCSTTCLFHQVLFRHLGALLPRREEQNPSCTVRVAVPIMRLGCRGICGNWKLRPCLLFATGRGLNPCQQKHLISVLSVLRNSSHMGTSPATPQTVELQGSG